MKSIPREVGIMSITLSARKNLKLIIEKRQYSILTGSLLGDAYIHPQGKVQFEHSSKAQRYLEWKFRELEKIRYKRIGFVERRVKNKHLSSYRFWTRQYFRPLRAKWYRNGKKIVPSDSLKDVTPLALAVWYMDDGYFEANKKRCIIATDGFSKTDRIRLKKFLEKKYSVNVTIRKSGKISMTQAETENFFRIISPYRLDCMRYKFPNPLTTKT